MNGLLIIALVTGAAAVAMVLYCAWWDWKWNRMTPEERKAYHDKHNPPATYDVEIGPPKDR